MRDYASGLHNDFVEDGSPRMAQCIVVRDKGCTLSSLEYEMHSSSRWEFRYVRCEDKGKPKNDLVLDQWNKREKMGV